VAGRGGKDGERRGGGRRGGGGGGDWGGRWEEPEGWGAVSGGSRGQRRGWVGVKMR